MTDTISPARRLRRLPLLALLVLLALLAAGCGDDGGSTEDPSTDGSTDDDTSEDDNADDDASEGDSADDTSDDDSTDDDTSEGDSADDDSDDDDAAEGDSADDDSADDDMSDGDVSGDAASSYCALARQQDAIDNEFPFLSAQPEEVEAYFLDNRDSLAEAVSVAPPEIRADLETILVAFDEDFLPVLAAADWNFLDAGEELDAIANDPTYSAAQERLEAYDTEVCDLGDGLGDLGDDSASDDLADYFQSAEGLEALLQSDFGRQAIIEGFTQDGEVSVEEAECLLDNLDISLLVALGSGGAAGADSAALSDMLAAFDSCGITPEQFN